MNVSKWHFGWQFVGSFCLFISFNFLSEKFDVCGAYFLPDGTDVHTDKSVYPLSVAIWPTYALILGIATAFLRQTELKSPGQLFKGAWLAFVLCYLPSLVGSWTGIAHDVGLTGWHSNTSGWGTTKLSAALTFAVVWLSVPLGALLRNTFNRQTVA